MLRALAGRCLFKSGIACSVAVSLRYVISHANMTLKLRFNSKIHTMPTDCSGNNPALRADERSRGFDLHRPVALSWEVCIQVGFHAFVRMVFMLLLFQSSPQQNLNSDHPHERNWISVKVCRTDFVYLVSITSVRWP